MPLPFMSQLNDKKIHHFSCHLLLYDEGLVIFRPLKLLGQGKMVKRKECLLSVEYSLWCRSHKLCWFNHLPNLRGFVVLITSLYSLLCFWDTTVIIHTTTRGSFEEKVHTSHFRPFNRQQMLLFFWWGLTPCLVSSSCIYTNRTSWNIESYSSILKCVEKKNLTKFVFSNTVQFCILYFTCILIYHFMQLYSSIPQHFGNQYGTSLSHYIYLTT